MKRDGTMVKDDVTMVKIRWNDMTICSLTNPITSRETDSEQHGS
jgi:hypothetical protein